MNICRPVTIFRTCFVWIAIAACLASAKADRPNVVMILADDLSYRDIGFLGNDLVHTPNIDRLAAMSARYPNGYVPMSVCRPSLATLLTGLYPHQHGIHFNHPPPGLRAMRKMTAEQYRRTRAATDDLIRAIPTLPRTLAANGYACLQTGKHWEGDFGTAGFTEGMTLGRPDALVGSITGTRLQDNGEKVAHGNGDAGLVIGRETMRPIVDFVNRHAGARPFMIWYAPFLPHVPFDAPERFRTLYRDKPIAEHMLPYYAEIARFDETVGQLLDTLAAANVLDNTLIVFASDNGFRPDPARHERFDDRSKLSQFEDGLRTPLLIRWDGEVVPADHPQLVQTIDVVPTVLSAVALAGDRTIAMRGIDLMPSARGSAPLPRRPAFGAIYPNDAEVLGEPARHVRARWVREGRFKLILSGPAGPGVPSALFDLVSDPLEQTNLIDDPNRSETVTRLSTLLDAWWQPGEGARRER